MKYRDYIEEAQSAMERIHSKGPFEVPRGEERQYAKDVATVMHFLKTTAPNLLEEACRYQRGMQNQLTRMASIIR